YYVARSSKRDKATARRLAATVLEVFQICPLSVAELRAAVPSPVSDYEDAVQVIQSLAAQVDVIVTRDVKDFANAPIRAITPAEFVKVLQAK
ncbi:MAG: PIN domain-containing protein, partial [Anaerolineales bacterium]|nr:PIN domain-containing protein [Anaerolineales bacterium]